MSRWPYPSPETRRVWRRQPDDISILELSTGFRYNAKPSYSDHDATSDRYAQRFSVSYVTGSHAFKAGVQLEAGRLQSVPDRRRQRRCEVSRS